MKKALSLILVVVLLLSLCACGNKKQDDNTGTTESTGTTVSTGAADATGNTVNSTEPENTEETQGAQATEPTSGNQAPAPTQPAHTHSWKAATCTAAKTCTVCGATEGSAAGHSWKDATCAAPKTCTVCGATEGDKAGHTLTETCTVCGQANQGYKKVANSFWEYEITEGDDKTYGSYYFFSDGVNVNVEIGYTFYKTLKAAAAEQGTTEDALRAEYADLGMIETIDGVEYMYNGWGMDNWSGRRFKEENGVVTVEFLSLDWDENDNEVWTVMETVVLTRTGLAELTVTSSTHSETPVGLKLIWQDPEEG